MLFLTKAGKWQEQRECLCPDMILFANKCTKAVKPFVYVAVKNMF
jgi:hypothetical protein